MKCISKLLFTFNTPVAKGLNPPQPQPRLSRSLWRTGTQQLPSSPPSLDFHTAARCSAEHNMVSGFGQACKLRNGPAQPRTRPDLPGTGPAARCSPVGSDLGRRCRSGSLSASLVQVSKDFQASRKHLEKLEVPTLPD